MKKSEKEIVGQVVLNIELEKHSNAIPMVGWHSPYADFEHEGKTYTLSIAGGCQQICVKEKGKNEVSFYSLSIGAILPAMLEVMTKAAK